MLLRIYVLTTMQPKIHYRLAAYQAQQRTEFMEQTFYATAGSDI